MKKLLLLPLILLTLILDAQNMATPTLKSILVEQLKTTHNKKDWFVPVNTALEGLTPEQANWKDGSGNHSIAQLATHLLFWNQQILAKFKGEKPANYSGNNDETFSVVNKDTWATVIKNLDAVLTELEQLVESADDEKLKNWYPTIANVNTHNAYHTGQIIYVRKLQGAWDPEKGVK